MVLISVSLAARAGGFPKSLSSDSFWGEGAKFAEVKLRSATLLLLIKTRKFGL